MYYQGSLSYQENSYPDEGELEGGGGQGLVRVDEVKIATSGVGMQFSRSSALELNLTGLDRESNVTRLGYSYFAAGLTFRYGFSPDREYI